METNTNTNSNVQMPFHDGFIDALWKKKCMVSVYLTNGIQLQGRIGGHDQSTIIIRGQVPMMVYKHAVSTIMPVAEQAGHSRHHNLYGRRNSNQHLSRSTPNMNNDPIT